MKCPECQFGLDSNGLIAWCENGHAYKLESTEYPCFVDDGTYCSVHTPAELTPVLPTPAMLDAKRAVDEYGKEEK